MYLDSRKFQMWDDLRKYNVTKLDNTRKKLRDISFSFIKISKIFFNVRIIAKKFIFKIQIIIHNNTVSFAESKHFHVQQAHFRDKHIK